MEKGKKKPILLLDFDGVIHSYTSGWKGAHIIPDPLVPGAADFIASAVSIFDVQIYSSRSRQPGGIQAMKRYLSRSLPPQIVDHLEFPKEKPPAFLTIDDRCICFDGNFPDPRVLLDFKPWNKKGV